MSALTSPVTRSSRVWEELPEKRRLADKLSWPERKFRPLGQLQQISGNLERVSSAGHSGHPGQTRLIRRRQHVMVNRHKRYCSAGASVLYCDSVHQTVTSDR